MSKLKTYIISIRIDENTINTWQILKTHNIRVAEIFKEAGSKAILQKLLDFKIKQKQEILPF